MTQSIPAVLAAGRLLPLEKVLASGGEGQIWSLQGNQRQLAKMYKAPAAEQEEKLRVMLAHPPRDPGLSTGYVSLAWPQELLRDSRGACVGFLMPTIDRSRYVPLFRAYVPQKRLQLPPGFTWQHLLRVACNIASVVHALHERGYVLGDVLNESNVLVDHRTALICLVDLDSLQVPRPGGGVFRCPVGKSEFTPPELQGGHFRLVDRKLCHDTFALAVLVFLLLMQGKHPYDGVPQGTMADLPLEARIRAGYCPYTGGTPDFAPPPDAPAFATLTQELQRLFKRCFVDGHADPERRPTASEWYQALVDAERQCVPCAVSDQHFYFRHLPQCPWCVLVRRGFPDPFTPAAVHPARPAIPPARSRGGISLQQPTSPSSGGILMVPPGQRSSGKGIAQPRNTPPAGSLPPLVPRYSSVGQQAPTPQVQWHPYVYNPMPVPRRVPRPALLLLLLIGLPMCGIGGTLLLAFAESIIKAFLHLG